MSSRAPISISQLGLACLPGILAAVTGGLLSALGSTWTAVATGGAIAAVLALVGAVINAASVERPLHVALLGAMLSFTLRVGGVIAAAFALGTDSAIALTTLGSCLAATLIIEMLSGWMRVVRHQHTAAAQEPVRA